MEKEYRYKMECYFKALDDIEARNKIKKIQEMLSESLVFDDETGEFFIKKSDIKMKKTQISAHEICDKKEPRKLKLEKR